METGPDQPRRRRRKESRPGEILSAASAVFAERGFTNASIDEVARRAGIAKGTVYLYFATKIDLFRAVVDEVIVGIGTPSVPEAVAADVDFGTVITGMLTWYAAQIDSNPALNGIIRLLLIEGPSHPELSQIWYKSVVEPGSNAVANFIAQRQAAGEIHPGDPHYYTFSLLGPIVMGEVFRHAFAASGTIQLDFTKLATQHAATMLRGMLVQPQ